MLSLTLRPLFTPEQRDPSIYRGEDWVIRLAGLDVVAKRKVLLLPRIGFRPSNRLVVTYWPTWPPPPNQHTSLRNIHCYSPAYAFIFQVITWGFVTKIPYTFIFNVHATCLPARISIQNFTQTNSYCSPCMPYVSSTFYPSVHTVSIYVLLL